MNLNISMEPPLLDRYLQSVGTFLPTKNRKDILAELRANLMAEFEERDAISEDAQADILRQHGHPLLVASHYFAHEPLIGPAWIGMYWFVLKLSLGITGAVILLVSLVNVALERITAGQLLGQWFAFIPAALGVFTWVTLIFMSAEYFSRRYHWLESAAVQSKKPGSWDPRKVPYLSFGGGKEHSNPKQEFFGACLGLVILVAARGLVTVAAIAGRHGIGLADPAWSTLYQLLLAAAILSVIAGFAQLVRPDVEWIKPASGLLTTGIVVLALANFHHHGPWLVSLGTNAAMTAKIPIFNVILHWQIVAWIVGMSIPAILYAWQCIKLLRRGGGKTAMHPVIL